MTATEWAASLFPKPGYFVEAGAHDGIGDSLTYALELAGWTGICVEPSNAYHGLCQSRRCRTDHRPLWRADGATMIFREVAGNAIELSGFVATFGDHWDRETRPHVDREVTTVSLPTLLREHGAPAAIELLCLDTEGSELAILEGHDFNAYLFAAIVVEHNGVSSRQAELREFLASKGYCLDARWPNGIEDWFLHRSVKEPRA